MNPLVEQTRQGSIRAAGRLISLLEDDPTRLPALFSGMESWPQPRLVLGITGAPGVGKSTLVDRVIAGWRERRPDRRVGVLAVDPSSPYTGGAILGDRVRMMKHATDPMVFIRSLSSRGHLGGLTLGTRGSLRVLGLLGCDLVLVETVGVGQSEVEVVGVADRVVIVMAPGQGDSVQMIKAGLMETGDIFAVNKADRPGADRLMAELRANLALAPVAGRDPAILAVSAATGQGIEELIDAIERMASERKDETAADRQAALLYEVRQALLETARRKVDAVLGSNGDFGGRADRILKGQTTVDEQTEELMRRALERHVPPSSSDKPLFERRRPFRDPVDDERCHS